MFQKLVKFPAGAKLYGNATYDNTTNNPFNPSNPPVTVSLGESTLDEMMVCFFSFLEYQSGDENLVLDSTMLTGVVDIPNAFPVEVFPNPAHDQLLVQMTLPDHNLNLRLTNELGAIVKEISEMNIANGAYSKTIDIGDLPSGMYFLEINSGDERVTKKVMKVE